ncbi:MAG: DUF3599 family protein [Eubacterium sp.]|nr:DUF3599 family protein [Eubacterium sp.]
MAWEDMLNHQCDIYHVDKTEINLGYGITDTENFSYPEVPDLEDVACHFHIKTGSYVITQNEPVNNYDARVKVSFPIGTDIRVNDKVVSKETGFTYIAELPRTIRNDHHIIVFCNRQDDVKEAV